MWLVKHDEISERKKLKASISALKENRKKQLKERMKEKTCQLDEFYWLVLRSLYSQRLVLLTKRKKGNIMLPVYLISAVWPQTPTT